MKGFIAIFLLAIAFLWTPVFAQDSGTTNMQILIEKVKADKKLLIASNMNLTEPEAKKFWPLYEGYQKDLEKINGRLDSLINDYAEAYNKGSIPEELAKKRSQMINPMTCVRGRTTHPTYLPTQSFLLHSPPTTGR